MLISLATLKCLLTVAKSPQVNLVASLSWESLLVLNGSGLRECDFQSDLALPQLRIVTSCNFEGSTSLTRVQSGIRLQFKSICSFGNWKHCCLAYKGTKLLQLTLEGLKHVCVGCFSGECSSVGNSKID